MVVTKGISMKSPVASGPLKPPHPQPAFSSLPQPVWKIVSPALGKEEGFQTTRFIWDVTAPSPTPFLCPVWLCQPQAECHQEFIKQSRPALARWHKAASVAGTMWSSGGLDTCLECSVSPWI